MWYILNLQTGVFNYTSIKLQVGEGRQAKNCDIQNIYLTNVFRIYNKVIQLNKRVCLVSQLCPTLCDPMEPFRLLCPWNSPGKNTGVGSNLPAIFSSNLPDPGIEPGSPALRVDSLLSEPPRKPQ